jgi:hypothetical protein
MKEIESSFAIDEDEEGAIPTLRDLQSRVQDPMHALTHRAASLEARLRKMEVGPRGHWGASAHLWLPCVRISRPVTLSPRGRFTSTPTLGWRSAAAVCCG